MILSQKADCVSIEYAREFILTILFELTCLTASNSEVQLRSQAKHAFIIYLLPCNRNEGASLLYLFYVKAAARLQS